MISKHTVEIEIDWLSGCDYVVMPRRMVGIWKEDMRKESWWSDDNYILIERPKPDRRYRTDRDNSGRFWYVFDMGHPSWTASFDKNKDPDAERHAREFADMLNREAGE